MDSKKIGNFIKQLRENKKMSQEQLAEQLYVTRQAISSWETGKSIPDIEKFQTIAKIFNISIAELYAGEKIKKTEEADKIFVNIVKDSKKKIKKMTIVCIASLLLLIFSFFTYYFINSYKSIKVYLINNLQENIKINGLFLTSKEKFYFDLNISGIDVAKTNLLYFDNNEYKSIYSIDDNKIFFEEKYGTNEYFNYKKLNVIENNLYLEIIDNNKKNYIIKLDLKRDFVNDSLLFLKEKNIVNNNYYEKKDIPIKIEEKFNLDDDVYKLNLKENNKNISLYYMVSSRRFGGSITNKNENIDWTYDMDNKIIEYYKFDDKLEKINSFTLTYEDAKNISDEYGSIILNLINKYIYNES